MGVHCTINILNDIMLRYTGAATGPPMLRRQIIKNFHNQSIAEHSNKCVNALTLYAVIVNHTCVGKE